MSLVVLKSNHKPEWWRERRRRDRVTLFKPAWVWCEREEKLYSRLLRGFTLHCCSGYSELGDIKLDINPDFRPTLVADIHYLPFRSQVFDTLICDPPWHGPQTWMRFQQIIREFIRVARTRIILILGTLYYHIPKPFELREVYIVKKIPPLVHLVYVWERRASKLDEFLQARARAGDEK